MFKLRLIPLALAVLGLSAAACASPVPQGGGQAAASSGGAGQPKYGGIVRVRVPDDPANFDQSYVKVFPASESYFMSYNKLLSYKTGPDVKWEEQTLAPELAESWEVSPDARTYTFHLRKGVSFANLPPVNGRELTADDVRWTFEYWSRTGALADKKLPKALFDWMFEGMTGIETPDPYTVKVSFKDSFAPFLNYVASWRIPVIPHEIFDKYGDFKDNIVGSGPFQLDRAASQAGSHWNFKKNANYWEPGKPYIDGVTWLVVRDEASAHAAFKTRQVDYLGNSGTGVSGKDISTLKSVIPDMQVLEHMADTTGHYYVNIRPGKPLSDVRIRRAINLGLNRDEFIKVLSDGRGRPGLAAVRPDSFTQEEVKQLLRYDPAEAKRLVSEAAPNGINIEMKYPGADYGQDYITAIQLFQAQMKPLGININLKSITKEEYNTAKGTGDYEIIYQETQSIEGDLDSLLFAGFHSSSKKNYPGTKDPKLDALVEAQRKEADPAKRQEIFREAGKYINVEQAYDIATNYNVQYEVWQPYLKNFYPHISSYNALPVAGAWLDK